jgi:assimilatory nitrate reductase catalytic subunit
MFARTERVVTLYSQGVNQSVTGTDKVNAILNCHLATGRIGRAGMGPFSLTGQPNAMGGREVGGLANQLAAHMAFTPKDVARVGRFWHSPGMAAAPGLKAVELFEAVGDGRVKAIWIAATNPADSMPRAHLVRAALEKCPLVVCADAWPTDTTRLAHIVLPAASWAEKDGTVTNSERCISRQRAFRAAPGQARPDWWMFAEVARRMGWGDAFSYAGPADIFREHAALSAFENDGARLFNLGALADIDDAAYDALAPLQWPVPRPGRGVTGSRLFARGGFSTPDGRARMIALTPRADEAVAAFPLTLNTGRVRDQWHTMTRTGRVPHLMTHVAAPMLALHPRDAAARGIAERGLVRVESAQGAVVMRATVDEGVRPGDVFAPMHWTDQFASSGPIDRLVHALTDPVSGQPDLKGTPVSVGAVTEIWRGNLLRLAGGEPELSDKVWWAKVQAGAGFAFELAGWERLDSEIQSETVLRRLLHIPADAELVSYSDPRAATFRYAGIVQGRLTACAFFGPPGADFAGALSAKSLLGRAIEPAERMALLAGLDPAGGKADGKIVCSCFFVSEDSICGAIRDGGLTTPAAIGKALKAGTNCGSCIPEIKKLIGANAPSRVT